MTMQIDDQEEKVLEQTEEMQDNVGSPDGAQSFQSSQQVDRAREQDIWMKLHDVKPVSGQSGTPTTDIGSRASIDSIIGTTIKHKDGRKAD